MGVDPLKLFHFYFAAIPHNAQSAKSAERRIERAENGREGVAAWRGIYEPRAANQVFSPRVAVIHPPRRRGDAPPRYAPRQAGTTLPSKMRIRCPSNFVSSKKASSSLKPSDISCSSPMAIASPSGSDSV